jgi:hypothetical protein
MKNAVYKSLILHIAVVILLALEIPYWGGKKIKIEQAPIIIDLKDVKISEMTNLPELAKRAKKTQKAIKKKKKVKENYSKKRKAEPKKTAPKPKPKPKAKPKAKEKPKSALVEKVKKKEAPKPKQKDVIKSKPEPKPEPKVVKKEKKVKVKPAPKKEDPELANPLKSLLASVEKIEKDIKPKEQQATIKEDEKVNNIGVKGGTGGSYFNDLTISETDMIAGRLRGCWNIDPGARGIEDMIVEIRAYLNKDGTVNDVQILDKSRYKSDPHFKSVAESARRAVYICAPYNIFAEKYSEKYDVWKTILMRFNPLDGNVS